jgi:hypothetical protein
LTFADLDFLNGDVRPRPNRDVTTANFASCPSDATQAEPNIETQPDLCRPIDDDSFSVALRVQLRPDDNAKVYINLQ